MFTYHIVSDDIGNILAVYGEALLSEAQEKARKIKAETGCQTYLHHILIKDRPRVGQTISMKGIKLS